MGIYGEAYTAYRHTLAISVGGQVYPNSNPQQANAVLVHHASVGTVTGSRMAVVNGEITDLVTDATGNLYALARFRGSATIGSIMVTPTAANRPDYLIVKWNAAGIYQWRAQGTTLSYSEQVYRDRLTVDASGRVAVVGAITSALTLGAFTVNASGNRPTLFCAQLDASGNTMWLRAAAGVTAPGAWPTDLAADPATDALLIAGSGNAGFSWNTSTVGENGHEMFWMRLNASSGALLSDFSAATAGVSKVLVASGGNGNSYLAFSTRPQTFRLNGALVNVPTGGYKGGVIARLDPSGVPQWVDVMAGQDSAMVEINALASVPPAGSFRSVTGDERCYVAGSYSYTNPALQPTGLSLPPTPLASQGFVSAREGWTGTEIWSTVAGQVSIFQFSQVRQLSVSPAGGGTLVLTGATNSGTLSFNSLQLTYPSNASWDRGFAAKLLQSYNTLTGRVYLDANNNNQFDPGEQPAEGAIVEMQPGATHYSTDATGSYSTAVELGSYSVSLPNPPLYYSAVAVGPPTTTFSTFGNVSAGHDFALQPTPGQQDLRVDLTMIGRARPGFAVVYRVTYRNVGTMALAAGDVTLALDGRLTYLSNTGGGTIAGNTLTANYANLLPGQTRNFDINCQLPTNAVRGSRLISVATVGPLAGELTPADNTSTDNTEITASYDPNDIQVNYARLTPTQVAGGAWLEYTIRFQNTGTDTAFSVLLRDSLPVALLNLGTLQLIASSHNCHWGLRAGGLLTVQYTNIRLPYRNVNTIGSMGFVRFRVKPRGTLIIGDLIPNQAAIHFDYNAPVITNTALTEVGLMSGVTGGANALTGGVWPNPAREVLTVEASLPAASAFRLTLLDVLGRPVLSRVTTAAAGSIRESLDVRGLPAGLYLLRAEAGAQAFTRRVVIR